MNTNEAKLTVLMSALLIVLLSGSNVFATPISLNGGGTDQTLAIGSSYTVSSELTLSAVTRIGQPSLTFGTSVVINGDTGIEGALFLHATAGIGAKGVDLNTKNGTLKIGGSPEVSGEKKHEDEAIIFNYSVEVDPTTIILGLNNIIFPLIGNDVLKIDFFSGPDLTTSLLTVPFADILDNYILPDAPSGTINFSGLTGVSGIGSIRAFTVRATDGHFYVNSIDHAAPVPEPSTLLLFGIGLAGLGVLRKHRALNPNDNKTSRV